MTQRLGIVAIGRNEGERLRACLRSVVGESRIVVYVDSGSTDGSVAMAREMGAEVVELDLATPFTAARARNEGFARLVKIDDTIELVQFVDGDCEVVAGWLERAVAELKRDEKLAVVCGRRRERHPQATVYNRLCDVEWDSPVGEAKSCGGDAMIRASAFREVGGYDASVIAGEEPELCVRLRARGWTIRRIDAEMTLHDAAMTRFGQWWKRNVRAGHAAAEGAAMHGAPPERHAVHRVRSNWAYGLVLPLLILGLAWPTRGISFALLLAYPLLAWRVARHERHRGRAPADARLHGVFVALGKLPQAIGQARYHYGRLCGQRSQLIEYKGAHCADLVPSPSGRRLVP
ncbi:MAG TPA: glycosyltransferase family A protein [Tepidisphaeraceae bacterium]|nr:glycosyltransferase family A protein [Tepidisphaeraceae bacterium]